MGKRSGLYVFFLFVFLSIIVLFQVLSMIQSDRLYERVNRLEKTVQNMGNFSMGPAGGLAGAGGTERGVRDPNEGDWLVWNTSMEPSTLNTIHTNRDQATSWVVDGMIFETLLEYDPNTLEHRPLLAESYFISPDGMEVTFKIKEQAVFSDGVPVTADDVIFTFRTIKNPQVDAASLASYYVDINDVVKLGEREVKFVMSRKYFKMLEFTGGMPILPKHIYEFKNPDEFNKRISEPVGSGPFIFDNWDVGRQIVLKRNERYWGKRAKLARIVYRFITNDTASIQSLRSHDIDYYRPSPEQFYDLKNDPSFTSDFNCLSYWTPSCGYFYIGWNEATPFFNDKRVRLAMTHIVNRERICKDLLRNPDARVSTGPFYIYGNQTDPNIKPWPFDLKKASQLLDEAGWKDTNGNGIRDKNGVEFKFRYMIVSGAALHERIAKLVKDEAAKVGIQVQIDPYEWSVFTDRLKNHEFDATNLAWGGAVEEDPYQIWHSSQITNRGSNYISFRNVEVDKLIEEARQTLDDDKRNELYKKFHRIIHEEQPYTFVYTRPEQRFLDKRFEGVIIHKLGVDEREWFVPKAEQKY